MTFPTLADIPIEHQWAFRQSLFAGRARGWRKSQIKRRAYVKTMWLEWFGCDCPSCGQEMQDDIARSDDDNFATVDHILARALGGGNDRENITIICRACNNHKSAYESRVKMILDGFDPYRGGVAIAA